MEWSAVKSGWLFERKGWWSLGRKWTPRYVVLYDEPVPALGIYEQRSDASPPYAPLRHLDLLPDTQTLSPGEKRDKTDNRSGNPDDQSAMPSRRGSILGWRRRKSYQSLAEAPEGDDQKTFHIWRPSGGGKLCFAAKNSEERDDWLMAINGVLSKSAPGAEQATEESTALLGSPGARRNSRQEGAMGDDDEHRHDAETISCVGVTVMEGRVVARIKANNGSVSTANPFVRVANGQGSSDESVDSILGPTSQSLAVINSADPYDDLDALGLKYQQAMADRAKADSPRDILRLELQVQKLMGKFHSHVAKTLKRIVDNYHRAGGRLGGGTKFEEGPLRVMFIADYAQASEEVVAGAYAWLRQELNAARWVNKCRGPLQQPLMTVAEYKGFRVLAMLALPLSERTLALEAQAGILDEALLEECQKVARGLNLATYPYRTPDGKTINLAMPATVEVHHLERRRNRERERSRNQLQVIGMGEKEKPPSPDEAGPLFTTTTPPGYYITNVHDLMPPYPSRDEADNRGGLLFFRPEFIQSLPSPYAAGDVIAIKSLRDRRLPDFLAKLESLEVLPIDSEEWRGEMHKAGLNMALLGAIARETTLPHIREAAIVEMVARTAKTIIRSRLRGSILHFRDVQALRVEEELTAIVVEALNGILCVDQQWMEEILATVEDRFGYRVEAEQVKHLPRNALLMALQHHCSLQLAEGAYTRTSTTIDPADFLGFTFSFTDGGNGCFAPSSYGPVEDTLLVLLANIVLPLGETLWILDQKRAAAAKVALRLAHASSSGESCRWDRAVKFAELAAGLCPRSHPLQVLVNLFLAQAKLRGPAHLTIRAPLSLPTTNHSGVFEKSINGMGASPAGAPLREGGEDLKRLRTCLLNKLQRHFGPHHPLGIEVRERLADLFESSKSMGGAAAKEHSLALRREALAIGQKVLGRRHERASKLMVNLARAYARAGNCDEAIVAFEEAIQSKPEPSIQLCELMEALADCKESKGDIEGALEWAQKGLRTLEGLDNSAFLENMMTLDVAHLPNQHQARKAPHATLWEGLLERIARLSRKIFTSATEVSDEVAGEGGGRKGEGSALKELLSNTEDMLPEAIASHLQRALGCYERLFDARRKHDLEALDGQALLELARKIIMLAMRLATPSQRPVLRASVRRKLFTRPSDAGRANEDREGEVRELLVRMVTGPISPREMVEKVLMKAQDIETLAEAEADLALMLDLIEL